MPSLPGDGVWSQRKQWVQLLTMLPPLVETTLFMANHSRFPQLVNHKPQHLPKHRAITGNQATIQAFFTKVKDLPRSKKLLDAKDLGDRL